MMGPAIDPKLYRSTMGVSLGLRGKLSSAIVVLSCRRNDPARTLYDVHEWEQPADQLNIDQVAAALADARKKFHTVMCVGYYGGSRDDDKVYGVLSIRLGMHIEPAPHDPIAPTQLLVDDFRTGRLKAHADSLVARDAKAAIWRSGTPDQTGILAALRCAHWGAQQYRVIRPVETLTPAQKSEKNRRERQRRLGSPY